MAKKIKISRKQIKKPDEFITWSERMWDWADEHIWLVVGAVAGLFVLIILVQIGSYWRKTALDKPRTGLAHAVKILKAPIQKENDMEIPTLTQTYKSEDEKLAAAAKSFRKLVEENQGSPESDLSLLLLARTYEKMGDLEGAKLYYSRFLTSAIAKKETILKELAQVGLARVSFLKHEDPETISELLQNPAQTPALDIDRKLLLARILFAEGDQEKALSLLNDLKKEARDSWLARSAFSMERYMEITNENIVEEKIDESKTEENTLTHADKNKNNENTSKNAK